MLDKIIQRTAIAGVAPPYPRSFGVIYTADLRSSPGRYDRVPVLVPTTNEAKNDLFNHPDKLTEEQKKFRHTVCETLRELEAYDYTARVTNYKLALSLFPRMAERRNYTNEEQRRATDKIMDKLKEYTKQRGKYKPVLHGLWEMELPPGAIAGARKERYWSFPRPLADDLDNDAEED